MNASIFILLVFYLTPFLGRAQVHVENERKPHVITIDTTKASIIVNDSLYDYGKIGALERRVRHRLDSGLTSLNRTIDSVNRVVNNPQEYQRNISRLYAKFDSTFLAPLKSKADSLGGRIKKRMDQIEKTIDKKKSIIDSVLAANPYKSIQDLPINGNISDVELNMPDNPLSSYTSVPNLAFSDKLQIPGVDGIAKPLGEVNHLTKDVKNEFQVVAEGSVNTDKIIERIEKQIIGLKELDGMQHGSQAMEKVQQQVEEMTGNLNDQEKLKEEIKTQAKKEFVDHFAGHQDKIESEIKSMEKLQRKYHSVKDVRYLPKRRTNPEKGKPFAERLILGTSVQIDRKDPKWTAMDISPYVGYKFSDRFRLAGGGTYRVTFDAKTFDFTEVNKVYGYRTFGNYRIFNTWFGHVEFEILKMKIPPAYATLLPANNYEVARWIPMAYVGIFKTFSISKHIQGQTQVLYDFLKVEENFHFNKVAFRCGFEYKIIRKQK